MQKIRRSIQLIIGSLLLLSIALFNPIALGKLITADGAIGIVSLRLLLWVFTVFLLVIFCLFIKNPNLLLEYFILNYKNYILLFFTIIISLIFAEFVLRTKSKLLKSKVYYINSFEFNYTFYNNSHNFRDDEFVKDKDENTFRIFLIGDSFVAGTGVKTEDIIDRVLEKKCKGAGINCEVFNLGAGGQGPSGYLRIAKQFKDYKADLIIVSLYVDNDIRTKPTRNFTKVKLNFSKKLVEGIKSLEIMRVSNIFLINLKKSYMYSWVKKYEGNDFYKNLMRKGELNPGLLQRAKAAKEGNQEYYDRLVERFNTNPYTKENILAIRELYGDIPFLLLINPSKYQVNSKYFGELKKIGFVFNEDKVVDRKLQDTIISWATENQVDYVDILPAMKKDLNESYFYNIDDHYNARGTHLVAERIYNKLNEIGVLDKFKH